MKRSKQKSSRARSPRFLCLEALEDRLLLSGDFSSIFSTTTRGNIHIIANTLLTNTSLNGNPSANNNNNAMTFVDIDSDATTFNSSEATLDIRDGSDILFAGLYWGAQSNDVDRDKALFQTPNSAGYQAIDGVIVGSRSANYHAFADVTDLVKAAGEGAYRVANVQATEGTTGGGRYGGWSLVVAYKEASEDLRNLNVFNGYTRVRRNDPAEVTLSGFTTPNVGDVNLSLGIVAYEGDGGVSGDALQVDGTTISSPQRPANNFFNGTITREDSFFTAKNPDFTNQLGFDAGIVREENILANGASSTTLRFTSTGDVYFAGVLTTAIDVFAPSIQATTTVEDINGGNVRAGDLLEFSIDISNSGNDTAESLTLTNPIPINTLYDLESITVNGVPQTDSGGDDFAEFQDGLNQLLLNLGSLGINQTVTVTFRLRIDPEAEIDDEIQNSATLTFEGASTGDEQQLDAQSVSTVVVQINRPPVIVPNSPTVNEGETTVLDLLSDDFDPDGDPLTISEIVQALNGVVEIVGTTGLSYTPDNGFFGADQFGYTITDGQGSFVSDTVQLDVNGLPVAVNDTLTVTGTVPTFLQVVGNDFDPQGDPLTLIDVTQSLSGSLALSGGNDLLFTPSGSFFGQDRFTYTLSDGRGAFTTGDVFLNIVEPIAPRAVADNLTVQNLGAPVSLNVLANDIIPPGTTLTITDVSSLRGTVSIASDGQSVIYQAPFGFTGQDTLSYTVTDSLGRTSSALISLEVTPAQPGFVGATAVALSGLENQLSGLVSDRFLDEVFGRSGSQGNTSESSKLAGVITETRPGSNGADEKDSNPEENKQRPAQISGIVFEDDGDGEQGVGERGLARRVIVLEKETEGVFVEVASTVTDENGRYVFPDLKPGTYRARISPEDNQTVTAPFDGHYTVKLKEGDHQKKRSFGIVPTRVTPSPEDLDQVFMESSDPINSSPWTVPERGLFLWLSATGAFAVSRRERRKIRLQR